MKLNTPAPSINGINVPEMAREWVFQYVRDHLEKTDAHVDFNLHDVYVVWYCKTLQNFKVLASTYLPDGMYYEVTYDGDNQKAYIDAYKKFHNESFDVSF